MIGEVVRGNEMPHLISYLFGPGKSNEHVNQHLVAGYADAVFTAHDELWRQQPGVQRRIHKEALDLGWQVEFPRSRWRANAAGGYVWHCSLSIKAEEGQLTDTQWTQAAHAVADALGFSGADGKSPCRWVAVRHGLSAGGNDHIHIAVNLVREDSTIASTWNDYSKVARACAELETRFGLQHVPGRSTGRSIPEPTRADREISARNGEHEPLRIRLERTVRACAAAAHSEAHFIALARARSLILRPRYASAATRTEVTGYAVAARDARHACSTRTGVTGPIWFGGGKLATDLALPRLRERWETPGKDPAMTRAEALAAWSGAATLDGQSPAGSTAPRAGQYDAATAVADVLAAAASACEPDHPGPLARAARHMARAACAQPAGASHPELAAAVAAMASTFTTVTQAGSSPQATLILVRQVAQLVDACVAARTTQAATREATRAGFLVRASLAELTSAAERQAAAALPAVPIYDRGNTIMDEPTYEEDLLRHLTQAGVLGIEVYRALTGQPPGGDAKDVAALKAVGYTAETPCDAHLREVLGETRWAKYVQDPARIVCAAAITDGAKAGYDMKALLTKVFGQRAWEDDAHSPSQSIARVLAYRITRELADPRARRRYALPSAGEQAQDLITARGSRTATAGARTGKVPRQGTAAREPMPVTPFDTHLRDLLGEHRWIQYAADEKRRQVAELITTAAAEGRNVPALLTQAVTCRDWEDDDQSPSRRVASVLHYRVKGAVASGDFPPGQVPDSRLPDSPLPDGLGELIARSTAPASENRAPAAQHKAAAATPPPPNRDPREQYGQERD
ncbi:MAG TPA: hypothetical protein VN969_36560 [Streptosporangiaceae bacterium]|nr:hypothetical protein [Streptosporangiaceae bacterium]